MSEQFYDEEMALQQKKLAATPDMAAQRKIMLGMLDLNKGEHVLDVGSGNGIFASEIQEAVGRMGHVCGVDQSDAMVAMAKHICPEGKFLKGDATSLPVDDRGFDVVTASQLLCFVRDADQAVAEMFRALKQGGRLIILDSDWGSLVWSCRNQDLMERTIEMLTAPYADAHVPRTLSRRLKAAGFENISRHCFTVLNWEPDPDSYSQQLVGFIKPMMKASDAFTDEDWEAWTADQKQIAEAGEYMFSLNRYVFSAVKP